MKFRKKPIVINAVKFNKADNTPLVEFIEKMSGQPPLKAIDINANGDHYIKTLEGAMLISDGDYVICGLAGEFYPCKPDIFEKTYEAVD